MKYIWFLLVNMGRRYLITKKAGLLLLMVLISFGCFPRLPGVNYPFQPSVVGNPTIIPTTGITDPSTEIVAPTETIPTPTITLIPSMTPTKDYGQVDSGAIETLNMLQSIEVPQNDSRLLAERLTGVQNIPVTDPVSPPEYKIGDSKEFWANDTDTNESFKVTATMQYSTPHVYFWIENGVGFDQIELASLVDTFENSIYPTNREFFGSEWIPGVDNDPHIYILFARGLGGVGGYFSSADEILPQANKYSNAHEMFYINADYVSLGDQDAAGTLAHEFQHMIHYYQDKNEEAWLNEGFSTLAELINGFDPGYVDDIYAANPDIQLNYWPGNNDSLPYYGSSFLFVTYFLDRFGENATKNLVANQENSLKSFDAVFQDNGITDSQNNRPMTADSFFTDWTLANYLHDNAILDGRYTYNNLPDAPQTSNTEVIYQCPLDYQDRSVNQYGVDYISIECQGDYSLSFSGNTEVSVVPENPHSGNYYYWSNKGDDSDMTLTRSFDFTNVTIPLTLSYWTWYDIEKDYDYLYLEASEDGNNWSILKTGSGTGENPTGNSFGWGYNGQSNGWIQEHIDLSQYSGKNIQIRFEYVTDGAVNGEGFLLDDISIPQINYSTDFELDSGGWIEEGFARIQNMLPQTYQVSVIYKENPVRIQKYEVKPGEKLDLPLHLAGESNPVVLVVSGTSRFTYQTGNYTLRISR